MNNDKGFTLIELIVVIAVLGILSAVAIPRLGNFTQSAKESADKATFAAMQTAVAIDVADDGVSDNVAFTITDGVITNPTDKDYIEDGAKFQLTSNAALDTLTWKIDETGIIAAPTIDDDGKITGTDADDAD